MLNIYDSHLHLKLDDMHLFFEQIKLLKGFILILNTNDELEFFRRNMITNFNENFNNSVIAINFEFIDESLINDLKNCDIKFGVKIHPRLSKLTYDSINKLKLFLQNLKNKNLLNFIIIDNFYYGSDLKYHINLELSIEIAKKFFDINILLAHSGGHRILEYMLFTRDLKNIYYDLSLTINYLNNTSVALNFYNFIKFNKEKLLFGSDSPDFSVKSALTNYNEFLKNFDESYKKNILENNFKKFLKELK
ncbi:hypothetical protein C3L23_08580 [Nautilia sp. PV-1]|uniref:hypothetical protein n=1 Tax=Nautilia sp. PV-1 TaxID=2579250 RepID=UPI000FD7246F|nr:hypothetical protein [Nautilia sp. PV-1]AZV47325.1 hypothetical protein C3L23_08580 [Nautilia sp. PV-1]